MTSSKLKITAAFLLSKTKLTWTEVHYAMERKLLDMATPIDLAMDAMGKLLDPPEGVMQLAASSRRDRPTLALVERLSKDEPHQRINDVRSKWAYLTLAWMQEHELTPELLGAVSETLGNPPELKALLASAPEQLRTQAAQALEAFAAKYAA
jgi:hypothetical protein